MEIQRTINDLNVPKIREDFGRMSSRRDGRVGAREVFLAFLLCMDENGQIEVSDDELVVFMNENMLVLRDLRERILNGTVG